MPVRTAFDSFMVLIGKFRQLAVGGFLTAGAAPFVSWLVGVTPPWPPGVEAMTALIELVAIVLVFHSLYEKSSHAKVGRLLRRNSILWLVLLTSYLVLLSLLVYAAPDGHRFVKGFECLPQIAATFPGCPLNLDRLVIEGVAWEADDLWTSSSIALNRALLAIVWLASFLSLSAVIGSFIVYYTGRPAREIDRPPAPAG